MEELLRLFNRIQPLEPELLHYILSCLKQHELKRKTLVLKAGEVNHSIYFIEKGVLRSYRKVGGQEKTTWVNRENDIVVVPASFFTQEPSTESVETLEPSILHSITYSQLEEAYRRYPQFNLHGRIILQKYYVLDSKQNYIKQQPALAKFKYLMEHQPDLVGRVSDKYLASYLGISKETFSRQKSKYANKKQ